MQRACVSDIAKVTVLQKKKKKSEEQVLSQALVRHIWVQILDIPPTPSTSYKTFLSCSFSIAKRRM